jgi:hypothetical protein
VIEQFVIIIVPVLSAILAVGCAVYCSRKILSAQKDFERDLEESRRGLDKIIKDGSRLTG